MQIMKRKNKSVGEARTSAVQANLTPSKPNM